MSTKEAQLEDRIAKGEQYLAAHPDDKEARDLFFRLLDQYTRQMVVQEIRASLYSVTLALPKHYRWKRDDDSAEFSEVRVLMRDTPKARNEITINGLKEINEALAILASAV